MRRVAGGLALAAVSAGIVATGVSGQAAAGEILQVYTFDDPTATGLGEFRLVSLPFAAAVPLPGGVTVRASGAYAVGTLRGAAGGTAELSGVTDTEVALGLSLGPDRYAVTVSAALPTGQSRHTLQEATVAGVVAAELLPFAITSWGSGGGLGGDVGVAAQRGRWGVGVAGGYRAALEYEPISGQTFSYQPGDQLNARLALDRDLGESSTLSVLVGFRRFSEDQVGGTNLFRPGKRFEGLVSYAMPVGLRSSALVYGGLYHRENGALLTTALAGATGSPSQQLYTGGLDLRIPVGPRVTLLPSLDGRVYRTADGVGQGWLVSAGGSIDLLAVGRRSRARLVMAPGGRFRLGRVVVRQGAESAMTGWEIGVTVRLETTR